MMRDKDAETLRAERARLVQKLEAIRKDRAGGLDRDSSEQAIQLENDEVLDEIARVTQFEIERIDELLSRSGN